MELTNEFTIPVPIERAWRVLTDVELIAPCLPGAQLQEIEGAEYRGVVKVKVGPITAQYKGAATFEMQDEAARKLRLKAEGRDTRGQGSASAFITVTMQEQSGITHVRVDTDLTISGKVAQFGRGMIADVSAKLLDEFVTCLKGKVDTFAEVPHTGGAQNDGDVAAVHTGSPAGGAAGHRPATSGVRKIDSPEAAPVDLVDTAGGSIAKRLVPVVIVLLALWVLSRRRSSRRA